MMPIARPTRAPVPRLAPPPRDPCVATASGGVVVVVVGDVLGEVPVEVARGASLGTGESRPIVGNARPK